MFQAGTVGRHSEVEPLRASSRHDGIVQGSACREVEIQRQGLGARRGAPPYDWANIDPAKVDRVGAASRCTGAVSHEDVARVHVHSQRQRKGAAAHGCRSIGRACCRRPATISFTRVVSGVRHKNIARRIHGDALGQGKPLPDARTWQFALAHAAVDFNDSFIACYRHRPRRRPRRVHRDCHGAD